MARENSSGLNVSTRYGVVAIPDGARGEIGRGEGALFTIAADFSAALINSDSINQAVTVLYPGSLVLRGWAEVETAVSLSGANAGLSIGRQGGLGTDSADLSGSAVGVGFKALGLKGTFSTGITATTTVVVAMASGAIEGGAGRLILEVLKA
jgi:hypothetical protein